MACPVVFHQTIDLLGPRLHRCRAEARAERDAAHHPELDAEGRQCDRRAPYTSCGLREESAQATVTGCSLTPGAPSGQREAVPRPRDRLSLPAQRIWGDSDAEGARANRAGLPDWSCIAPGSSTAQVDSDVQWRAIRLSDRRRRYGQCRRPGELHHQCHGRDGARARIADSGRHRRVRFGDTCPSARAFFGGLSGSADQVALPSAPAGPMCHGCR